MDLGLYFEVHAWVSLYHMREIVKALTRGRDYTAFWRLKKGRVEFRGGKWLVVGREDGWIEVYVLRCPSRVLYKGKLGSRLEWVRMLGDWGRLRGVVGGAELLRILEVVGRRKVIYRLLG